MLPTTLLRRGHQLSIRNMQDELCRSFDQLLVPWPYEGNPEVETAVAYPVDIHEDDQKIYVDAEMPGFKATDIDVTLSDGTLNISGERTNEEKDGKKHLYERRHRTIRRSFSLPSLVEEQNVKARFIDGVLHLELNKVNEGEPTRIEVK